jgi:hypothetical protein
VKPGKGRAIALGAGLLTLAVLGIAAIAFRDAIVVEWARRMLESEDLSERERG